MIKSYCIQKGTDPSKDIWLDYGIIVMKTEGLNQFPEIKDPFIRDWSDEQGDDTYLPEVPVFNSKTVTLTLRIHKDTVDEIKLAHRSFMEYILGFNINYFDTYRNEGFRGYYTENNINDENYRLTGSYLEFEIDFTCSNGICFGFDNSGKKGIFVDVNSGYADLYYSDGSSTLGLSTSDYKTLDGGFLIVCPSVLGGVNITEYFSKLFLTSSGKLLLTENANLLIT